MKYETTRKAIYNRYDCISIGYCNAWHLLIGITPDCYTCGIYGWNADIYLIGNGSAIVTGYRPFGFNPGYELVREYESKARKIWDNRHYRYDTKINKIAALRAEFINKVWEG